MRTYTETLEVRPSLIGTLSTIGGTAIGAPVDIRGFKDVLATLVCGAVFGSGAGSTVYLDVKLQQSASATGTGALWSDIVGEVNPTCAFSQQTFTGTDPAFKVGKLYERFGNNITGRYIRAHATLSGTVGLGPKILVNFILGRPNDTLYINDATTAATGNPEFTLLR